jgi:tetratricopeptide (TPR) repeat protein
LDDDPRPRPGSRSQTHCPSRFGSAGRTPESKDKKYQAALEAYIEAQKLDPTLEISAQTWNEICLFGSLRGEAAAVLAACEKAVTLEPGYIGSRGNLGIAKAIAGDKDGAIKDFQAFIELSNSEGANRQVQGYIDALRAGENPFTDAEIKRLLGE